MKGETNAFGEDIAGLSLKLQHHLQQAKLTIEQMLEYSNSQERNMNNAQPSLKDIEELISRAKQKTHMFVIGHGATRWENLD